MEKYELKKLIKKLSKVKARATELISLYIPAGYNINDVKNQLSSELSLSSNIKSKQTRKAVLGAIEKLISSLKSFKKTPGKGLAVFSGDMKQAQGKENTDIIMIDDPPEPIEIRMYRCDQKFILKPLKDIIEAKNVYALISLDRSEAAIAFLKGTVVKSATKLKSCVPGKMRAGGQSAARFSRVRDNLIKAWIEEIALKTNKVLLPVKNLRGIIVGGPSNAKKAFTTNNALDKNLKKKIIGVLDTGYAGVDGIKELVQKSGEILEEELIFSEKRLLTDFFGRIAKGEKVTYGMESVINAIKLGAVEKVLLSEDLEEELIEKMETMARGYNSKIIIVSTNTEEGQQFKLIGGIGAFLRYSIGQI